MDGREHRALFHLRRVGPNIGAIENQWDVRKGSQFATVRLHTHAAMHHPLFKQRSALDRGNA